MNSSRKYEYVMNLPEIREFCRFVFREQLKYRKYRWIAILCIIAAEALYASEAAAVVAVLLIIMLGVSGIYSYRSTAKILDGQSWTVFPIEDGRLKVTRVNLVEIPCRDIQFIRRTKHLIMLGYLQSPKRPVWIVIPVRVFESEQEREAFVALIRNPQAGTEFGAPAWQAQERADFTDSAERGTDRTDPQEYMRFSYFLDREKWVRLQKGAADLLNSGTMGRPVRTYGMAIWGGVMAVALTVCTCLVAGEIRWTLIWYSLGLTVWLMLRLYARDPEKRIRKQLDAPEVAARECGLWQVSLTQKGVTAYMPTGMKSCFDWDSLAWLVETQEAFYLFYKDKKHLIVIAKESFVSWDQVDAFHRICAERGVQKISPKKARYVPEWLTWAVLGLILFAGAGVLALRIFLDSAGAASGRGMPSAGGYAGIAAADDPAGYSSEVFWFDFEGFDISTDYVDVLNGMLTLAQGSPLDSIGGITEDMDDVDWERGRFSLPAVSENLFGTGWGRCCNSCGKPC